MNLSFIADKTFKGLLYTETRLPQGEYDSCIFEGCDFSNSDLSNTHFLDCEFMDCNLSNTHIKFTLFKDVFFKDCKLLGLKFSECDTTFMAFRFEHSNLSFASFYQLSLPQTLFKNCNLQKVDFVEAKLKESCFENSNLDGAIFKQTDLSQVDFSTAFNMAIDPTENNLNKAKFSKEDALSLLVKFNIIIDD